jgi:hypothetical protein
MTIKEQFNKEWEKYSVLKDPIQKETAEFFYRLGAMNQDLRCAKEIESIINRIQKEHGN